MDDENTDTSAHPGEDAVPHVLGEDGRKKPITFEETPVIDPVVPSGQTPESPVAPSIAELLAQEPKRKKQSATILGEFVIFVLLFGVGVFLSMMVRPYLNNGISLQLPGFISRVAPTPTPLESVVPTQSVADPFATWKSYDILNGSTRKPIAGISYKLPPEVAAPGCDSGSCASQGTQLPGGTRFTAAARGGGQVLADFRGGLLTDISGQPFAMRQLIIAQKPATEYIASFSGRTAGGYSFTRMRGVMINITDTLTIEFNHFTPSSSPSADFAEDDALFNSLLETVTVMTVPTPMVPASGSGVPQGNEPG